MLPSPSIDSTRTVDADHPQHLREMDRDYLIGWGSREILMSSLFTLVGFAVALALSATWSVWWLLTLLPIGFLGLCGIFFFRNPQRNVPNAPGLLVAPADGEVWDITEVSTVDFIDEPCVCIGIFLSIFSVHVNRAPARGRVESVEYCPGRFHDARKNLAATENEANSIVLECEEPGAPAGIRLLVRQISGAVARRIICPLPIKDRVARGGLLGMIKYGSRTELYIPQRLQPQLRVRVGDKVSGGESVVAAFGPAIGRTDVNDRDE